MSFIFALAFSMLFTFLACRLFPHFGLVDNPKKYGLTRRPIPYFGGLGIIASILLCAVIFLEPTKEILAVLIGAVLLTIVSFIDDARGLPISIRLLTQAAAAGALVVGGLGLESLPLPMGDISLTHIGFLFDGFWGQYYIHPIADALTLVWIMLLVNSFNWMDGIPGQSVGISAIAAGVLALLAASGFHTADQTATLTLALAVLGACLGFFCFTIQKNKILLGDTGSQPLGFLVGSLAILSGGKIATTVFVASIPVLDALLVMALRMQRGQLPWKGDLTHAHHRLLAAGLSTHTALWTSLFASTAFGAAALMLPTTATKIAGFGILAIGFFITQGLLIKKGYTGLTHE